MSAIFARGQNGLNGGQNFKMPQSTQKAYQITRFVVQNLKKGIVYHISDLPLSRCDPKRGKVNAL